MEADQAAEEKVSEMMTIASTLPTRSKVMTNLHKINSLPRKGARALIVRNPLSLIWINASGAEAWNPLIFRWRFRMSGGEMAFLGLVVGALTLFGSVLAWASWEETRTSRKKEQS